MRVQSRDGQKWGTFAGDWQPGQRYFFQSGARLIELECVLEHVVTTRTMPVLRPLRRSQVQADDVRKVAGFRA